MTTWPNPMPWPTHAQGGFLWVHRLVGDDATHEASPLCFCCPIPVSPEDMNDPRRDVVAELNVATRPH